MFLFDFVANNQYNLIMFSLFKRKPIEKESNVASTPEPVPEKKEKWTKIQVFFLFIPIDYLPCGEYVQIKKG